MKPHNLKKKPKRRIMTFSSIAAQTYLSGKTSSTLLRATLITNCAQRLFLSVSLSAIIDGKMSWFFYCLQHFWDNFVSWKKDHFEYSLVWIIFAIDFYGIGYSAFCVKVWVVTCYISSVLIFELSLIGIFICLYAI